MKALILAGGFATRLRPLSCSKPKLMFPVVGVPLVESMARWLGSGGVDRIILAVNHLSDRLKVSIGNQLAGLTVTFSIEETPLGTAGPIKLASDLLGSDDAFIVVNGDIVTDIDLKAMVAIHNEKKPNATIALVSAADSSRYGSVLAGPDGVVRSFIEKSDDRSPTSLVNAGVYVLSPKIVDSIPIGRPSSLERETFPRLAQDRKMQAWIHNGIWYDIGRIPDYIRANKELLGLQTRRTGNHIGFPGEARLISPSFVGVNTQTGPGSTIGPNSILSHDVSIGSKSTVKESIIFEETEIGEGAFVEDSIVGEKVVVGRDSRIGRGSVVAGQLVIPAGTRLAPNSTILC